MNTNRGCGECWGKGSGWIFDLLVFKNEQNTRKSCFEQEMPLTRAGQLADILTESSDSGGVSGFRGAWNVLPGKEEACLGSGTPREIT